VSKKNPRLHRRSDHPLHAAHARPNDRDKPAEMAPVTLRSVQSRPPFPLGFIPLFRIFLFHRALSIAYHFHGARDNAKEAIVFPWMSNSG
jgi:hypothetical protein